MSDDDDGKSRDEYEWSDLVGDLALMTSLDLSAASAFTWPLRDLVHPYDAIPYLRLLVIGEPKRRGEALAALLQLAVEKRAEATLEMLRAALTALYAATANFQHRGGTGTGPLCAVCNTRDALERFLLEQEPQRGDHDDERQEEPDGRDDRVTI